MDRSHWPIRKYRLGEEPEDGFTQGLTMEENFRITLELSEASFALTPAGRKRLPRDQWPIRVLQLPRKDGFRATAPSG
ncbi:MAG: hypothetical protein OXI55_12585 [Gammaproteobacteria bacterium]|nr:hypothetical protein [Gammaproteobacteria bacterium]